MSKTLLDMFVKVFRQIFDSSIAEDHRVRHTFMDLCVLADRNGVVDMTHESISRVTNVPLDTVRYCITELEAEDPKSRNGSENGRRLVRLDQHRDWGWQIVNYEAYRDMRDEEARKAYFRERKRIQRARQNESQDVLDCPTMSNDVQLGPAKSPMQMQKQMHKEEEIAGSASPHQPTRRNIRLCDEEFLSELKSTGAYPGLDLDHELKKMHAWLLSPKGQGKKPTRARFVNWLARADSELPTLPGPTRRRKSWAEKEEEFWNGENQTNTEDRLG